MLEDNPLTNKSTSNDLSWVGFDFKYKDLFCILSGYKIQRTKFVQDDNGNQLEEVYEEDTSGNQYHIFNHRIHTFNFALSLGIKNTSPDKVDSLPQTNIEKYWEPATYNNYLREFCNLSLEEIYDLSDSIYPNHQLGGGNTLISRLANKGLSIAYQMYDEGVFDITQVNDSLPLS
tara:strand:+ start:158 stop:682 length:525 start_codon:yes stop_codon:yes gene_type:complete